MKNSIHKKVLRLVLGAGMITFVVLGIFSYLGRSVIQRDMENMSVELGEKSLKYTDELLVNQLKLTLGKLAIAKAQYVNRGTEIIRMDATVLADAVTEIMSHPENYSPKTLPDPRTDEIRSNEPYVVYAPDIRDNLTPEIQNELGLVANAKDIMTEILRTYEGSNVTNFIGGAKGWHVGNKMVVDAEGKFDSDTPLYFSPERIYEFDPRKRPWYLNAQNAGTPVIADLYHTIESGSARQIGASAPFYDAEGNLIGVAGVDYLDKDFYNWVGELGVNKSDINFVLNKNGEVIFSSEESGVFAVSDDDLVARLGGRDLRNSSEKTLATAAAQMVDGEQGVLPLKFDKENFYIAFAPIPATGWSYGMVISENALLSATYGTQNYFQEQVANLQAQMRKDHSYFNTVSLAIPLLLPLILFLMSASLSRKFVKPIHELSDGVRDIASGNLDNKLNIKTGDEIEHLAVCFNAMTDELKTYMTNLTKVTAEKERIATELDVATEIQRGMLPKDLPAREDFELLATMTPAKEVGGDFYDFYMLDETHLAITVADVSGKGIPAALFMVISKTVLNNFAKNFYEQNGLAPVVAAANEQLCANNDAMMFVTVFIGVLDLETGEFVYVNAGHNPPVVYRAEDNHCDFLDVKKNFVMGPMDGIPFVEQKILLKRGDLIFIYTDGVTEALNVAEEEYLPDRLINFMNSTDCRADLQTLLKNIRADVAAHVGDAAQSDDITMFALRFNGKG